MDSDKLQLFENREIRTAWDGEKEEWYFSVVDVVAVLTDSPNPNNYWKVLKKRLKDEGNQSVTFCNQLKLKSPKDGKRYLTDVATTEQLLRIIQSIPSPKAEPFKLWLAEVGRERIEETIDPELTIDRALETYLKKGYSREWIHQRLQAIQVRRELTDEWRDRGVKKGAEYAILTDEITRAWSGMTTKQYKKLKGAEKGKPAGQYDHHGNYPEYARGNFHNRYFPKQRSRELLKKMWRSPAAAEMSPGLQSRALEAETGKPVITSQNAAQLNAVCNGHDRGRCKRGRRKRISGRKQGARQPAIGIRAPAAQAASRRAASCRASRAHAGTEASGPQRTASHHEIPL